MPKRRKASPPPLSSLTSKLWKTLQVAGYPVRIFITDGLEAARGSEGETRSSTPGEMGPVYIDASLVGTIAFAEVLLHELTHVVENCYGLEMSEQTVRLIGLGLHQLLAPVATFESPADS